MASGGNDLSTSQEENAGFMRYATKLGHVWREAVSDPYYSLILIGRWTDVHYTFWRMLPYYHFLYLVYNQVLSVKNESDGCIWVYD